ncbi:MAG: hypothetical protein HUU32_15065 [Calditrichaceae bacterium]|nr:hypothetical protein [Calditrichia bacterium]NUQ42709.1 hypothetical protein [Calditrichaceae bacterium]
MKYFRLTWIMLALTFALAAQEPPAGYKVKYITAEHVYLDAGAAAGLSVGDVLYIVRSQEQVIAKIEVVFVAENSASCKILSFQESIRAGDVAVAVEKKEKPAQEPAEEPEVEAPLPAELEPARHGRERSRGASTRLSGSISAQFYHLDDRTESNLDFTRPALRVNLRARRLWGRELTFRVRTRTYHNMRTRPYNLGVPEDEWRNRVYELSLSYDEPAAPVNFRMGRIISNFISGVGYIDGGQLQYNMSPSLRLGAFAGTRPDWRTSSFQTGVVKYGGYLNFSSGSYQTSYFESTLAGAMEQNSGTVSREFIYLQNILNFGSSLNFFQSAEVDINRDWRKEKTGESVALTSLYLSGRYRVSSGLTLGAIFDNRKNYWTYEIQTLADSLFDDALRTGLRGNISLRLPGSSYLYANAGVRKRQSDPEATRSFSAGFNNSNLLWRGFFLQLSAAGFNGPVTDGYNGSAQIGQNFSAGHRLAVEYGAYAYTIANPDESRTNRWARAYVDVMLLRRVFVSGQYEYAWGQDLDGQRILAEIGYRF